MATFGSDFNFLEWKDDQEKRSQKMKSDKINNVLLDYEKFPWVNSKKSKCD